MILTLLMLCFSLVAHWLSCVWYVIAVKEQFDNDPDWDIGECITLYILLVTSVSQPWTELILFRRCNFGRKWHTAYATSVMYHHHHIVPYKWHTFTVHHSLVVVVLCAFVSNAHRTHLTHTHKYSILLYVIFRSAFASLSAHEQTELVCVNIAYHTAQGNEEKYDTMALKWGLLWQKNKRKLCTCCSRLITQTVIDIWAPFVSLCMRLLQLPTEMMGLCTPKSPERTHTHTTHHTYSIQQTCSRYTILWMRNLLSTVDRFRFATI